MKILDHRIDSAPFRYSPNCDARPDAADISLLVIHCISLPPEQFGGPYIEQLFCNHLDTDAHPYFQEIARLRVSAHVVIRRDGELLQFVPFDQRAWHAGVSCYQGRERCNDFSIGIELEGSVNQSYCEPQYQKLIELTQLLLTHYPKLNLERIVGHSDIAPGRKDDPGGRFDWRRYRAGLAIDSVAQKGRS
ncbi:1,6-anhydro-N-acetylmuramyl-L-alanine amidase AmpD [Methylomonas methanica]|uniref:1,6-anhydro-N-acetylmuramyl-L-alanine amidase AmpD n=1 Tax=Methylomonas methanica (strain DSM 25384 / MC09) TaxID=857087 RepID=G0A329_METMM|nr:1,6-anhydro-N-acetylmuramyl-L-alanine amidase AmpD [Methylomonas methanica]AEG02688.1 N-acetylmuramyl-L-alanine amidase, negative regulator of AmpC, AmpD [Methylomonas methanica MC09]